MKQALEAKQTPLIELLERVPADARMVYEHDQFHSENIPVGRLCHEAAAALRAAIEQAPVAWMYDFLSDNEVIRDWVTQSQDDIARENGFNVRPLYTALRQKQYDQTSLELCEECGWKAVIPDDGCLVCARQKAPREWVELTDDEARALVNRATFGDRTNWQALVYMVDAKLKEKNA